jgi:DNA-binding FadR family transcriptional regulator
MNKWEQVRVQRRKVSTEVSERIERMIVSGHLTVGELLPSERELTNLLGVGRTSVREALFALSRKGLISLSAGERPRVTNPNPSHLLDEVSGLAKYFLATEDGARQFQDARKLFECAIARRAAEQATAAQIDALRQALELNLRASDPNDLVRTDMGFHYAIAVISGNRIVTSICDALSDWLSDQRVTAMRVPHAADRAKVQHQRIYRAIAEHNAEAADRAMADHLIEVTTTYWKAKSLAESRAAHEREPPVQLRVSRSKRGK